MAEHNTIVLPDVHIHVRPRESAALVPIDALRELAVLAYVAQREPWKLDENFEGDDWLVASYGSDYAMKDDGKINEDAPMVDIHVTTDHVRRSERLSTARDDAEWCVRARKLIVRLAGALMERERRPSQLMARYQALIRSSRKVRYGEYVHPQVHWLRENRMYPWPWIKEETP